MSAPSDARRMSDRAKEVTEMLSRIKWLCAAAFMVGVVAATSPMASLAANVGGGP
jgi:hypothetical protein